MTGALLTFLLVLLPVIFLWWMFSSGPPGCNHHDYATITGIKDASNGGIFTSELCVYTTDHGDIAAHNCNGQVGQKIDLGWRC